MLSKDWDINIEEREAEFRDDLRAASGVGKRRRKVCLQCSQIVFRLKDGVPFRKDGVQDQSSLNKFKL